MLISPIGASKNELSAGCSELCNLAARVQAVSYMAHYNDKTPRGAFDAQLPRIQCFWGQTTQIGCVPLILERCTKIIYSGNSESPVTNSEVVHDALTFGNCHLKNISRPGRLCFKLAPWQWVGLDRGFCPLGFVLISPLGELKKK